jgi:hypothetical protein
MSKGVVGQAGSSVSGGGSTTVSDRVSSPRVATSVDVGESPDERGERRGQRRRRRRYHHHHHHHHNLQKRTGKGYEFAFVTLLAIAILFWILFTLLPRAEKHSNSGEESHLTPPIRLSMTTLAG